MADWRGRGGGRLPTLPPPVKGVGGPGHGGGRFGLQPTISGRSSWVGHGKGKAGGHLLGGLIPAPDFIGSNPAILRLASMAAYELRNHIEGALGLWKGRGKGRAGSQPQISPARETRGTESTTFGGATPSASAGNKYITDPEGAYIFVLELQSGKGGGSEEVAHFLECSGLKSSTTVFEIEEGGMNHRVHKLPGQSRWENLTLRYGVTADTTMLKWRGDVLLDKFDKDSRQSGAIVVKNNQMKVVRRYDFVGAWPVSWEGPNFNSQSNDLAIETIELAHNGIEVKLK